MNSQRRSALFLLFVFLGNIIVPYASAKAAPSIPDGWKKYTNTPCGFTVYLPGESTWLTDYETDIYLRVQLPILDPQTNLSDKYVEIQCRFDPESRIVSGSQVTEATEEVFNGINFTVQSGQEGAAGSLYQAARYSAEQDGKYAVLEFVLRSGNGRMQAAPAPQFDYAAESAVFEEIMNTFTWGISNSPPTVTPVPPTQPVTITPTVTMTPPAAGLCPFDNLFKTKKEIITFLENPPLNVLEYNSLVPWTFAGSTRGYDEGLPKWVIINLEADCLKYQSGQMTREEMQTYETRLFAFKRLTYTELGLQGLFPAMSQLTYDATKAYVETAVIGLELISAITKIADVVEKINPTLAVPIKRLKKNINYWMLDSVYKILGGFFDVKDPKQKKQHDGLEAGIYAAKLLVDTGQGIWEILKDQALKRYLAEQLIGSMLEDYTVIERAARSVYPDVLVGSTLPVLGSDQEAQSAVQRVITAEVERAKKTHDRTEKVTTVADIANSITELEDLMDDALKLEPLPFISKLSKIMDKWMTILDYFSQWLNAYATFDSGYNLIVVNDRLLKMDRIAFDPAELRNLKDFHGFKPAQLAALDILPSPENETPANIYYSEREQRFFAAVDTYEQKIEETLLALEKSSDDQVIAAVDSLITADEQVARSLRVAEKPILGKYTTNAQVKDFLSASRGFSSSSLKFQVALMLSLGNRTDLALRQQVVTEAQTAIQQSIALKNQYALLAQAKLDISVTPSAIIANYQLPEKIVPGVPFSVKVTVTNPGTSAFSGHLSIRNANNLSAAQNYPGEIPPGQEKTFDLTLPALQSGEELVILDLVQNDLSLDSILILIQPTREIGSPTNLRSIIQPYLGYLISGGLGLLCLVGLMVGFSVLYRRSRKPAKPRNQISASPNSVRMKRAIELARAKKYEEAINLFRSILQSEPNNQQAWFNLGIAYANLGNFREAEKHFLHARQLGHPRAQEALDRLRN